MPFSHFSLRLMGTSLLAAAIFTLLIYLALRQVAISQTEEKLAAASRAKLTQIMGWLGERRGDAALIARGPFLSQNLSGLSQSKNLDSVRADLVRNYLNLVKKSYQYDNVYILRPDGRPWISTEDPNPDVCPDEIKAASQFNSLSQPNFFFLCQDAPPPHSLHQDILFPIFNVNDPNDSLLGGAILRIDPSEYLFPLLRSWPFESDTGETLLISRSGTTSVLIAELKLHPERKRGHQRLMAMPMDSVLTFVQIGFEGFRWGRDQANVPVFSYSTKIPDTPWTLVMKIDETEALRGLVMRTIVISGGFLLLLLTALGLFQIWSQKESHRRLRESEENFRGMILRMQDAFFRVSFENGTILYCNPYAVKMLGCASEDDLIGQPIQNWILSEIDREGLKSLLENQGEIPSHINTLKTKQGKLIPVDAYIWLVRDEKGQPLYIESLSRNATARYSMEQELRQEKDKAQTYLNVAGVIILVLDANQNVAMINKKTSEILGYTESEMIGKNWFDNFKQGDQSKIKNDFDSIFKSSGPAGPIPEALESEVIAKNGDLKLISWHMSILRDENGAPTGVLLSGEDITEKKNMELKLLDAMYEAKAATNAKTDFLANMSHEIRTPLNAIIGLIRIALRSTADNQQKELLRKISQASESLLGIINDILDFSKVEAGKIELESVPFDLSQLFSRISDMTSFRAEEKGLHIDFSIHPDVPLYVAGDTLRTSQILLNLTTNAIKFSDEGQISVHAGLVKKENGRAWIEFSVTDTGIGMNQEQLEKLFQSFSQTDYSISRRYGGTGLGLAICKRLTDLMGGEISVSSQLGVGSVFRVRIPYIIASKSEVTVLSVPAFQVEDHLIPGMSVLVVEDNEINQLVARDALEQLGANVIIAASGEEALHFLAQPGERIQAVLMDLQMPGMDGYQTTLKIRQDPAHANLPIIAMTAHVLNTEKAKCFEIGMNDYVSKPIDPLILQATLRKWVPEMEATRPHEPDPVFDHDKALHRFAGRKAFYIKLLKLFASTYRNVAYDLKDKMGHSDFTAAALLAHSLRGAAGNISAMQVFSLATEVEDGFDNKDLEKVRGLLQPLDEAVQKAIHEISLYSDEKTEPASYKAT